MERIILPFTDGVSDKTKGYVDLTDIIAEAVNKSEQEIKKNKKQIKKK